MPIATVNGVRLNFVQLGERSDHAREDLVMVHGLATNLAFWYFSYAHEFAKRFRVTLFDMRGHGRSEMTTAGYSPASLSRDMAQLLDHLEIESAHFLAHSFGGLVTMNFACAQPRRVSSLVLADTHIKAARHTGEPTRWAYGESVQPVLDRLGLNLDTRDPYFGYRLLTRMAQWQLRGDPVPDELNEVVSPLIGRTSRRTAEQWLRLMSDTTAKAEMKGDDGLTLDGLRALRFPILTMYGENSQARPTGDKLLEVWPHAEFRLVRGAGHFFPVSRPQDVVASCERFWGGEFNSVPRRRAGEVQGTHFRSDRVYMADGAWYVTMRGNGRLGPFAAREDAYGHLASPLFQVAEA